MMTDRLPDWFFGRRPDIEADTGLACAGRLVTDIPGNQMICVADRELIEKTVAQIALECLANPTMLQAAFWRSGVKPPDGLDPPFDDTLAAQRMQRVWCFELRIEPQDKPVIH